jgi:hypothetical protein
MVPSDFVSGRTVVGRKGTVFGSPDGEVRRIAGYFRGGGPGGSRFRTASASEQAMDEL